MVSFLWLLLFKWLSSTSYFCRLSTTYCTTYTFLVKLSSGINSSSRSRSRSWQDSNLDPVDEVLDPDVVGRVVQAAAVAPHSSTSTRSSSLIRPRNKGLRLEILRVPPVNSFNGSYSFHLGLIPINGLQACVYKYFVLCIHKLVLSNSILS